MEAFYCNLLGATVSNIRGTKLTIVAAWRHPDSTTSGMGVRCMGVGADGEQFLVDLPATGWNVKLKST